MQYGKFLNIYYILYDGVIYIKPENFHNRLPPQPSSIPPSLPLPQSCTSAPAKAKTVSLIAQAFVVLSASHQFDILLLISVLSINKKQRLKFNRRLSCCNFNWDVKNINVLKKTYENTVRSANVIVNGTLTK